MNTFRIYEDFRESLGEPAARALAQTLGAMFEELQKSVPKEDFRALQSDVSRDISRLDTALAELAEAQKRTEQRAELADRLEPVLDEEALEDLSRADAIATGLVNDRETFIIAEVSSKADVNDVRRAVRWAGLLTRAGLPAIPLVDCDVISDRTLHFADQQGVRIFKQGRLLGNPAA